MTAPGPVRVVHVVTTLTTGGAERQLESLVGGTAAATVTVALYAGGPVADAMRARGDRVVVLGTAGWRRLLTPLLLWRLLRRLRPDVVHVHLLSAQLWGIPAARLAGVPVVVSSEHSLMDDTTEGRPLTHPLVLLVRVLARLATRVVAVSATTRDRLVRRGVAADRVTVVDNGLDFAALAFDPAGRAAARAELGLDADAPVVVCVGRLDPVKRTDQVLRVVADRLHAGATLLVVGAGPLLPRLQAQAASLGVADRVRWLGARPDVPRLLWAADVLVSASRDETFGMAVVEGLGAGLPVVHVQAPALDELDPPVPGAVRVHVTGQDAADDAALAAAVDRALASAAERTAADRRAVDGRLVARYGSAAAAAAVDRVYAELVRR